jgi:hypothetical protein
VRVPLLLLLLLLLLPRCSCLLAVFLVRSALRPDSDRQHVDNSGRKDVNWIKI